MNTKPYRKISLDEVILCKDRVPTPGDDMLDRYCRNENCDCFFKGFEEVYLYIDAQNVGAGKIAEYTRVKSNDEIK